MYSQRTRNVLATYSQRTRNVLATYSQRTHMYSQRTNNVLATYSQRTNNVLATYSQRTHMYPAQGDEISRLLDIKQLFFIQHIATVGGTGLFWDYYSGDGELVLTLSGHVVKV